MPVQCVEDNVLDNRFHLVFRFLAPMFHNFVVCASPFPPVFGVIFALPASFVAATGLSLRLFVPQAADKSWLGIREHPDAECPAER